MSKEPLWTWQVQFFCVGLVLLAFGFIHQRIELFGIALCVFAISIWNL